MILSATRRELIDDLPEDFRASLNLAYLSDLDAVDVWKRNGMHRSSWFGVSDSVKIKDERHTTVAKTRNQMPRVTPTEREYAGMMIDHVLQRISEMRSGITEDMTDEMGFAKWSGESPHFVATVEFKRKEPG